MNGTYGYLSIEGPPEEVSPNFSALFANSTQILATILEDHHRWAEIQREKDRLQKEVEAKTASLRESDERHRAMIANISDVIGIISPDGIIDYKSPNSERWFGWKPEDLMGTDAWGTVHPDEGQAFGIVGMQERVARLGGDLTVSQGPRGGTTVRAETPLRP